MAVKQTLSISKSFPSIRRTLQYIEWTFIIVAVVSFVLGHILYHRSENSPPAYIVLIALSICAGLSIFFPLERPMWQRQTYIILNILCLLVADNFALWGGFQFLLYLVLAKSCFLLRRRDVIITTIVTGVAWQISVALSIPALIELMRSNIEQYLSNPRGITILIVAVSFMGYCALSTFVLLLCFLALAEQKSRQKALALAAEVEVLAADLERNRIARDIHDSLGHTLTTLDIQLEVAQTLHHQNPDRSLQALNTAKNLASQSLKEVRQAISSMREESFDLKTALNSLVEQMNCNETFKMDVQINLPKLPLQISQPLYLIIKEGLTNIQKHSQASSIKLWAESTSERITLGLSDNGIGFDSQKPSSGFGLRGMQERVKLLEGQIKIHSTPNKGTLIQVTIPR